MWDASSQMLEQHCSSLCLGIAMNNLHPSLQGIEYLFFSDVSVPVIIFTNVAQIPPSVVKLYFTNSVRAIQLSSLTYKALSSCLNFSELYRILNYIFK